MATASQISFCPTSNNGKPYQPIDGQRRLGELGASVGKPERHQTPQRSKRGLPRLPKTPRGTPETSTKACAQDPHHGARRLLTKTRRRVTALATAGYDRKARTSATACRSSTPCFTHHLRLEGRILQIEERPWPAACLDTQDNHASGNIAHRQHTQRMGTAPQHAVDPRQARVRTTPAHGTAPPAGAPAPAYMKRTTSTGSTRIQWIRANPAGYTLPQTRPRCHLTCTTNHEDPAPLTQCNHIWQAALLARYRRPPKKPNAAGHSGTSGGSAH